MVLQFLYPKLTAEMFSLYTFKTFFSLHFAFKGRLLGNLIDVNWGNSDAFESQVRFFLGDSYSKKSSSGANSSCELCLDNFCHVLIFRWFS